MRTSYWPARMRRQSLPIPIVRPGKTVSTPLSPELFTVKLEPSGQQCDAWATDTLLDSIEMGGLQWPSSCRNGTCRTCLGHIRSGSVHYQIDWPGLTAEEKAEGCVLPCVAYPNGNVSLQDPEN